MSGVSLLSGMSNILITGGSGLIGQALTNVLMAEGHMVRWLSRTVGTSAGVRRFAWDIHRGTVDAEALVDVDHIIHLSGAGIADKRWTEARMRELHLSRGGAARLLLRSVREIGTQPKSFISASGIGYYGAITSAHVFTENDPPCNDAIGRLTKDWEDAADEWSSTCRVVKLRTAMVLAADGGALKRLSLPVRFGLGAALGSGEQWMPWIHITDLVSAYAQAVRDERMHGAYNMVADEQPTNKEFTRDLASALRRPLMLPKVPAFALRLALGKMSAIVLEGSRVSNEKIQTSGSRFTYPKLGPALRDALGRKDQ